METFLYGVIFFASFGLVAAIIADRREKVLRTRLLQEQERKRLTIEAARSSYEAALSTLRTNPSDPMLRSDALSKGRIFSDLSRNSEGVTLYDEVALKNDLDAAAAAASRPVVQTPEERLRTLDDLRDKGLLTPDEHAVRRAEIIGQI